MSQYDELASVELGILGAGNLESYLKYGGGELWKLWM